MTNAKEDKNISSRFAVPPEEVSAIVIVSSGNLRGEDRAKAEQLGIREIVSMPSRITDLTDVIERLCIVRPTKEPMTP